MLKATEIVIEHLIIGFIFLAIVALFLFGHSLMAFIGLTGEYGKFFFTVLLIIFAYACGIVIDRWADTILDFYLRYKRLQVALEGHSYFNLLGCAKIDIFPENEIRLNILKKGGEISDYHDYLRTRMRLARAITCLLPALFMGLLLFDIHAGDKERFIVAIITILFYLGVLIYNILKDSELPRTDNLRELRCLVLKKKIKGGSPEKINLKLGCDFWSLPICALVLYTLGGCIWVSILKAGPADGQRNYWLIGYPLIGGIATVMVGWAWWRICQTFFKFIQDCKDLEQTSLKL